MTTSKNEKVLKFMLDNSVNGIFSGSLARIAKGVGFKNSASAQYVLKQLISSGNVEILEKGQRGLNVARYRVSNSSKPRSADAPLGEIIVEFGGVKLKLVYTDIGYCVSKKDLARVFVNDSMVGVDDYIDLIDLKIQRNREQFVENVTVVNGEQYMNRMAVMLYLNKLDLDSSSDEKRQTLNEFQTTLAENMCEHLLRGHVTVSDNDIIKLHTNIATLCDLSMDQVKDFLENIEHEVQHIINNKVSAIKEYEKKLKLADNTIRQKNDLISVYKGQITELRMSN